jgi:hypothetical protein
MPGETQDTATTGTLAWITPATNASATGRYAVHGSGLEAQNYRFRQADSNAAALTITKGPTDVIIDVLQALNQTVAAPRPQTLASVAWKVSDRAFQAPVMPLGGALTGRGLLFVSDQGVNIPSGVNTAPNRDGTTRQ